MATAKKTPRKRSIRKKKIREQVEKLGLVIAEACRQAKAELPDASPDERKQWVVSLLNEKLDIPILSENQEDVLLSLCVDVVSDLIFKRRYGGHRQDMNNAAALIANLRK
jgi:hypothetical protein